MSYPQEILPLPVRSTSSEACMVGGAEVNSAIDWLSRDMLVPILSRRLKSLHEKLTCEVMVCGIENVLVATLAPPFPFSLRTFA